MKIIPRPLHAIADYLWAASIAAAPAVANFQQNSVPANLCRALAASTVAASLCTRYEGGVLRVLPFKMHLAADLLSAVFTLASPWLLGFSSDKRARNTILGFALFEIVAVALSQTDEMA